MPGALWDDPVATWDDINFTWDGAPVPPVADPARRPLEPRTGGMVIDVRVSYDLSDGIRNTVLVLGPDPKPGKKRLKYVARAPARHSLSAATLARHGERRRMLEVVDAQKAKRLSQLRDIGDKELDRRLNIRSDIEVEMLPAPHLEENDLIAVATSETFARIRLEKATIPLGPGTMTIGRLRRIQRRTPRKRRGRRRGREMAAMAAARASR
jgi:hypothetical protein